MLVDTGRIVRSGGRWRVQGDLADLTVPPSVEAVVAARVDAARQPARGAPEPAAVAGEEFASGAVELAGDDVREAVPHLRARRLADGGGDRGGHGPGGPPLRRTR